ncbi:hypothetical protein F2Q68_00012355 [Brassica cretica]|uniref:Uncharacterized protein n=1 Tax=Brassica cretica TaxID=69181 RepID=A0A8S9L0C4_BRACR|nr:hypothetical protein F2Q68_00012355 [Brassica cretica]
MRRHRGGADEIFLNRSDVCEVEQTEISQDETESISVEKVRERGERGERVELTRLSSIKTKRQGGAELSATRFARWAINGLD